MTKTELFPPIKTADGIRVVFAIGNESPVGCVYNCPGCGVHEKAPTPISAADNALELVSSIESFEADLSLRNDYYGGGYHIFIYNDGNVTNYGQTGKAVELAIENFLLLLLQINSLSIKPTYVGLNSREEFITHNLLDKIRSLQLDFDIRFIIGVESLTRNGSRIYGKPHNQRDIHGVVTCLSEYNSQNRTNFGVYAGFVYLPEVYLEKGEPREGNEEKLAAGFAEDVSHFIREYSGHIPLGIGLHPYYWFKGSKLPYRDSLDAFGSFMEGTLRILQLAMKSEIYVHIGVREDGYETPDWVAVLDKHRNNIQSIIETQKPYCEV